MQESVITAIPQSSQWSITWSRVASDRRWSFLLIAMGVFSSIIYPHPPFVAFGAIAGTALKPRRAIWVALLIWLMNQVYSYTVRQYPWSIEKHCLWLGASALLGIAVFESLILSVDWLLTGSHTLTWAIARSILVSTTIWTIALTLVYLVFLRLTICSNQPIS